MTSDKKLVSVVLPAHNSAKWVEGSIRSVLAQSHAELELIVVDDGSTDETVALVSQLAESDSRLRLVKRDHCSGGPATPRNQGIEMSKGEYLAFIDSDDLWHPQKLELQLTAMLQNNLNFASTRHTPFDLAPPTIETVSSPAQVTHKSHRQLLRKNWVVTSSALISTQLFKDVRFNQQAEYIGVEDYVAWLDLHQISSIKSGVINSPLVFYRLRDDSISASKIKMARKIFYLLNNYRYRGKPLGFQKYYFFATYALTAIKTRLLKSY